MSPIAGTRTFKPWQIISIIIACIVVVLGLPSLMRVLNQKKPVPVTAAMVQTGPNLLWHPPMTEPKPKAKEAAFRPVHAVTTATTPQTPPMPTQVPNAGAPLDFGQGAQQRGVVRTAAEGGQGPESKEQDELGGRLKPTLMDAVKATRMENPELTVPQGTIIPCNDQTAIDTSYPGFVKATIPQAVFSAGGHVPLIDAGSTVFGSIQHGVINGLSRVFVLWQQITGPAPDFVRVELDSPAADELGRTGLDGDVNRHFWQKIEGALLLSTVNTGLQGLSSGLGNSLGGRRGYSNSLNLYQFQSQGEQAATALLQSTINIPDTLTRLQGQPCSIFVARDLRFDSVYTLRPVGSAR